jgi:hypothetical protein
MLETCSWPALLSARAPVAQWIEQRFPKPFATSGLCALRFADGRGGRVDRTGVPAARHFGAVWLLAQHAPYDPYDEHVAKPPAQWGYGMPVPKLYPAGRNQKAPERRCTAPPSGIPVVPASFGCS